MERKLNYWNRLLVLPLIQIVMRYAVLLPTTQAIGVEMQLSNTTFFCIVVSTLMISAVITRYETGLYHSIISAIGIITGGYIIMKIVTPKLALAYIMLVIMIWLYCYAYKRQFLIGNIYIAMFTAFTPLTVLLELPLIYSVYGHYLLTVDMDLNYVVYWCIALLVFTFLTVLSHEIIEDTEEFENDEVTEESKSLPFVMGATFAKWTVIGINTANIIYICVLFYIFLYQTVGLFSYISPFLIVATLILANFKVHKAIEGNDYKIAKNILKCVLLAGCIYTAVIAGRLM